MCGASFIDRNFKEWLERKLGTTDYRKLAGRSPEDYIGSHTVVGPLMQLVMRQFEAIKHDSNSTGFNRESYIELPRPLNQLHDPERNIRDGEICITE